MSVLDADIAAFEQMRREFEVNHRLEWVVFHDGRFIDFYADFDAAASDAIERFDAEPCLIRQVGGPAQVQLPGGMIFTHANAVSTGRV